MGRCIGIDLGTTNSVMAIAEIGGCRVLLNKENEQQTRSIVGLYKDEFLVGRPALNRWELAPENTIFSIKRLMGRAVSDPQVDKVKKYDWIQYKIIEPSDGTRDSVSVVLGGKEFSPVDISAMVLRKMKGDAEVILGEKVTHAVITVPAYFNDKQRHATIEAGKKAGLTVMRLLDEPTAAAIAFGIDSGEQDPRTILVYDLGGGTFDISVLLMGAGSFAPLDLEGDMWLGGDNFDQSIIDYVINHVKTEFGIDPTGNKRFMVRLRLEAQKAKEALSSSRATDLIVSGLLHDEKGNIVDIEVEITRDKFEDMIGPLVEKTVCLVKRAVEKANLSFNDIDYVLLAGNASSVPLVQESLEKLFGKEKLLRTVHPKNSVAIGAALRAAAIMGNKDMNIGNIAPFYYGIQSEGDKFNVFIEKNDQIPTPDDKKILQTFYTRFPNQRIISIPVYGGAILEDASKNEKQGEAFGILPMLCPQGTPIHIKLWLDEEGVFQLSVKMEDGTSIEPRILRGKVDQKAAEVLYRSEEALAKKEDVLSPAVRKEAERLQNEVLEEMQKKDFEKAEKKAEDLLKFVENAEKEGDPLSEQAEGLIGYSKYIANNYGWLIGQNAVYDLNNLIGELQESIDKKDRMLMEERMSKLNSEINKHMETRDASGNREPKLLGVLIGLHGRIRADVNSVDPAKANSLVQELNEIEDAFKGRQDNAVDRLNAFISKFLGIIEEIERRPGAKGTRECKKCGHENPKGARYCANCNADLWILTHEKASSSSASNIRRR